MRLQKSVMVLAMADAHDYMAVRHDVGHGVVLGQPNGMPHRQNVQFNALDCRLYPLRGYNRTTVTSLGSSGTFTCIFARLRSTRNHAQAHRSGLWRTRPDVASTCATAGAPARDGALRLTELAL